MQNRVKQGTRETIDPDHTHQANVSVLSEMPVFGGVPEDALTFIAKRAKCVELSAGDHFFHEGESGETMYVLRTGRVQLTRRLGEQEQTLGTLGPGDCFGEMALIDLYPRSATVHAIKDCIALGVSNALLYELYETNPEPFTLIMMNLAREISRRLRECDTRLFLRSRQSKSQRRLDEPAPDLPTGYAKVPCV